jgi:Holliday junction resolvasome RuvABC endonuclease subunit
VRVNVLGLDGSLQNFGMAVISLDWPSSKLKVEALLLSKTKPNKAKGVKRADDDLQRFRQHWEEINCIITKYNCSFAFGEVPSGAQDARAAFALGGITAMLACVPLPLIAVTPREVKIAATGTPHADKPDMIEAMYKEFPNAPWITSKVKNAMAIQPTPTTYLTLANEHLADACAVVKAGLKKI